MAPKIVGRSTFTVAPLTSQPSEKQGGKERNRKKERSKQVRLMHPKPKPTGNDGRGCVKLFEFCT